MPRRQPLVPRTPSPARWLGSRHEPGVIRIPANAFVRAAISWSAACALVSNLGAGRWVRWKLRSNGIVEKLKFELLSWCTLCAAHFASSCRALAMRNWSLPWRLSRAQFLSINSGWKDRLELINYLSWAVFARDWVTCVQYRTHYPSVILRKKSKLAKNAFEDHWNEMDLHLRAAKVSLFMSMTLFGFRI